MTYEQALTAASFLEDDYQIIVAPVADSVEQIRRIDLDRVLMNAHDNFPGSFTAFVGWLVEKRPDLEGCIDATLTSLITEGLWI